MARARQFDRLQRYMAAGGLAAFWFKAVRVVRRGGLREAVRKAAARWQVSRHRPVPGEPHLDRRDYATWVARYDTFAPQDMEALRASVAALSARPKISIVMPTYDTRREWLVEAIESVRAQAYPDWELCIADDASPMLHVREVLRHYEALDPRIRVAFRSDNGHISAASNTALELATGEWIALFDHDDLLAPHALLEVARAIERHPHARLLYSDEDKLDPRGRRDPYFKSDWNPELFLAQNMFSHFGVLHAAVVRAVGGFRVGLEGSQDYDLVLRCVEKVRADQVVHIPRVLYHWRVHAESTAGAGEAKPYARQAGLRAVREHLARTGRHVQEVRASAVGHRIVHVRPSPPPKLAVLVPRAAHDGTGVSAMAEQLCRSRPGTIVIRDTSWPEVPARLAREQAALVLLLREPVQPMSDDWLDELVRQACRPEVGVVAPMLVGARARIASGGVVLLPDGAGRFRGSDAHGGLPLAEAGHGARAQLAQEWSAVRDICLVMRVEILQRVVAAGACDENDGGLRLCAAVRREGLRVMWTPFSRVRIADDALARHPLGSIDLPAGRDPFYNPNLFTGEADFSLAWPPARACCEP